MSKWFEESEEEYKEETDDSDMDPDYVMSNEEQNAANMSSGELKEGNMEDDEKIFVDDSPSEESKTSKFYIGKKNKKDFKWQKGDPSRARKTPRHNIIRQFPGLNRKRIQLGNPTMREIWECLCSQEMINNIVLFTNLTGIKLKHTTNQSNYRNTDRVEIYALIGLLMYTSIFKSSHENMFDRKVHI
ncbi:DDE Tnp 1 7 domain containing protein [Asbolus verrucosus]|uniref:DDE Tnp 1 7 domain containing protein n=1 Tax=Asbolus verrucosus TaxID=1661398 RepID=A0A482VG23_ASBVE|nr:DDE Tnp 1 7 domain containing protein [Asbolus verrucosus]